MPTTRLGMMLAIGQGQLALAAASVALAEAEIGMLDFLFGEEVPQEDGFRIEALDLYPGDFLGETSLNFAPFFLAETPLWQRLNQPSFGPPKRRR